MSTLETIMTIVGERTRSSPYPFDIINFCNDAQTDFMVDINLPASTTIAVNTTDLSYALPANLKTIARMSLDSDDYQRELNKPYRIFNGNIIFFNYFTESDTINLDYFKHYTVYTDITDTLDLDSRFDPLYVAYCLVQHYSTPQQSMSEAQARQEMEKYLGQYFALKQQVISYYALSTDPLAIDERW